MKGAYSELITIGPALMRIYYINHAHNYKPNFGL
jgi:hypothetical protein